MINKKDFIEIEFTGRTKEGEIFDSNISEDLKKANLDVESKPFIFPIGEGMFLKGIEDFLEGKKIDSYKIELPPEKAFGIRDAKLIQLIPLKIFKQNNLNPIPGIMFNFDGRIAKILSSSGGRVRVDFNNPIAGKTVIYNIKVLRKIEDINEKAKALIDLFFRKDLKFQINENRIMIESEKGFSKFIELFKERFKDLLGLELEVKEIEKPENDNKETSYEGHNH